MIYKSNSVVSQDPRSFCCINFTNNNCRNVGLIARIIVVGGATFCLLSIIGYLPPIAGYIGGPVCLFAIIAIFVIKHSRRTKPAPYSQVPSPMAVHHPTDLHIDFSPKIQPAAITNPEPPGYKHLVLEIQKYPYEGSYACKCCNPQACINRIQKEFPNLIIDYKDFTFHWQILKPPGYKYLKHSGRTIPAPYSQVPSPMAVHHPIDLHIDFSPKIQPAAITNPEPPGYKHLVLEIQKYPYEGSYAGKCCNPEACINRIQKEFPNLIIDYKDFTFHWHKQAPDFDSYFVTTYR